jgi:hypothetical protein
MSSNYVISKDSVGLSDMIIEGVLVITISGLSLELGVYPNYCSIQVFITFLIYYFSYSH